MDDLRPFRCFLAVADELHFGRAARRLLLPQATVSKQVKRLETTIGAKLFERTTRSVTLTPVGEQVRPDIQAAVDAVDTALDTARGATRHARRTLSVGLAMDIDSGELAGALRRLRADEPDAPIEIRPMRTADQLDAIDRRDLDVGYVWEPPDDRHLVRRIVGSTGLVAFVPNDHELADSPVIRLADVAASPLVLWSAALNPWTRRRLSAAFREIDVDPLVVDEVGGYDAQVPLVLEGRGVGLTAGSVSDLRSIPGISIVPVDDPVQFHRCIVHHRDNDHPSLPLLLERLPDPTHDSLDDGDS